MNLLCYENEEIKFEKDTVVWEKNGVKIHITGTGNKIEIGKNCNLKAVQIIVSGNSNKVCIGSSCSISNCKIMLMTPANKRKVLINRNTYIGGALFALSSHENELVIGEDCMFSNEIIIRTEDGHPIFDVETKELCNKGGKVIIGKHCWIGERAYILKGVTLNDNSVVGACSVVSKSFDEKNIVIAGNPAKIVKKGIDWTKINIHNYKI